MGYPDIVSVVGTVSVVVDIVGGGLILPAQVMLASEYISVLTYGSRAT